MDQLLGFSDRNCLICGRQRLRQTGACTYCGTETTTIEVDEPEDSPINREHWGFE